MNEQPAWTDDEFPWINAEMGSNTQIGMAARIISRWGKDWHAEGRDEATYQSAHNDIMDLADTITTLLAERSTTAARVTELEQHEIESCPFCAATPHPKDHARWEADIAEYAMRCPNCGATGPNDISLDKAREMWNLRRDGAARVAELERELATLNLRLVSQESSVRYYHDEMIRAREREKMAAGKMEALEEIIAELYDVENRRWREAVESNE